MSTPKIKAHRSPDYSIEYAHIYTDQQFGLEQQKSIQQLDSLIKKLKAQNKKYSLTVLIDDYNPEKNNLDQEKFIKQLKIHGAKPHFFGFESQMAQDAPQLLEELDAKTRREYRTYIKKRQKVPCSLLAAVWYLKRLGLIKTRQKEIIILDKRRKYLVAKKIISILPKKYRAIEKKALEIIQKTRFQKYAPNISHVFFD